jgi:hypothetical protein
MEDRAEGGGHGVPYPVAALAHSGGTAYLGLWQRLRTPAERTAREGGEELGAAGLGGGPRGL